MKTSTKILSVILTLAMLLTSFVFVFPTAAEGELVYDIWDGTTATAFAGGTGAADDPYQIATGAQLAYMAAQVNSGVGKSAYYKLTANLDISGFEWGASIGLWTGTDNRFTGFFDGDGHTIKGFNSVGTYLKADERNHGVGLFGPMGGANTYIKNFKMIDVNINVDMTSTSNVTWDYRNSIAAACTGTTGSAYLENIEVSGTIVVNGVKGEMPVGGVIGVARANRSAGGVINCSMSGSVTLTNPTGIPCVGGVIGIFSDNSNIVADGCINYANVSATGVGNTNSLAGGIVGKTVTSGTEYTGCAIKNCVNYGDVRIEHGAGIKNNSRVGGIVGNVGRSGSAKAVKITLTNCANFGTISANVFNGSPAAAGALVGTQENGCLTAVTNCISVGSLDCCGDGTFSVYKLAPEAQIVTASGKTKVKVGDLATILSILEGYGMSLTVSYNGGADAAYTDVAEFTTVAEAKAIVKIMKGDELILSITATDVAVNFPFDEDTDGSYKIKTVDDLKALGEIVAGGNACSGNVFKIMDNLDCSAANWDPIGTVSKPFSGTLDGNGKTITLRSLGEDCSAASEGYGLFAAIKNATVKNLTVNNTAAFSGLLSGRSGALAAQANTVTITGVTMNVDLDLVANAAQRAVGGMIGYTGGVNTYTDCLVTGTIDYIMNPTAQPQLGGFVGESSSGTTDTFTNCVNAADLYCDYRGASAQTSHFGGLIGMDRGTLNATGCVNTGDILEDTANATGKVGSKARLRAGALTGDAMSGCGNVTATNCLNLGTFQILNDSGNPSGAVGAMVGYYEGAGKFDGSGIFAGLNSPTSVVGNNKPKMSADSLKFLVQNYGASAAVIVDEASYNFLVATGFNFKVAIDGEATSVVPEVVGGRYYYNLDTGCENGGLILEVAGKDFALIQLDATDITWYEFFGEGTEDDPCQIGSVDDIDGLRYNVENGKTYDGVYFALADNIEIDNIDTAWAPIGNDAYAFNGIFNGNYAEEEYQLTLTLTADGQPSQTFTANPGLFETLGNDAVIENLYLKVALTNVKGTNFGRTGKNHWGLLAASISGDTLVRDVTVEADVDFEAGNFGDKFVGGFFGQAEGGKLINCTTEGSFIVNDSDRILMKQVGSATQLGGFIGNIASVDFEGCVNNMDISVIVNQTLKVGGFAGQTTASTGNITFTDCVNNGTVYTEAYVGGGSTPTIGNFNCAASRSGGFIGNAGRDSAANTLTFTNCVNNGILIANSPSGAVGELIPLIEGSMTVNVINCQGFANKLIGSYKEACTVTIDEDSYAAGLETYKGAAVRMDVSALENSGIRFNSAADADGIDALKDAGYTVTIGTMIAPNFKFVDFGNAYELYNKGTEGKDYILVEYTDDLVVVDHYKTSGAAIYGFSGALKNILAKNYDLQFNGVAYITLVDGKGNEKTYFSGHLFLADPDVLATTNVETVDYSFDPADLAKLQKDAFGRSIKEIAIMALSDTATELGGETANGHIANYKVAEGIYSPYTAEQRAILELYNPAL